MSQVPLGRFDGLKSTLRPTDKIAESSYDVESWGALSQGRRHNTPAILMPCHDMSLNVMRQTTAQGRSSQPSLGHEPGTRLPGVRQLFLPHSFAVSDPSSPSSQHFSEQSRPISIITSHGLGTFPSPPKRVSESGMRALKSGQANATPWSREPIETSSIDAMVAVDHKTSHPIQAAAQQFPQISPLQEALLSPRLHQYGLAQIKQSRRSSSGSNHNHESPSFETIARQHSDSYEIDRHSQGAVGVNPWHDAPSHSEWGITKAGKPRKRLARACLNCRHKKIRCHPNPSSMKCSQCERTDLDCRFESG